MSADDTPQPDPDRQIKNQRGLFRLTLGLGFSTVACFLFQWVPGIFFCLLGTWIALFAWVFSPPWRNPFDPD